MGEIVSTNPNTEAGHFPVGRGLPREGVGAKKFGMPLESREINIVWRDIPGFCQDIPEWPETFEKNVFNVWPL